MEQEAQPQQQDNAEQQEQQTTEEQSKDRLEELLAPIIGKREEQGEQHTQQGQQAGVSEDAVLAALRRMSPAERARWALSQGEAGILKLMELQQIEFEERLRQMQTQTSTQVLEDIIAEWAQQNADLFSDPKARVIARGVDTELLERAGYRSYRELTPSQLRAHLQQVAEVTRKLLGLSDERDDTQEERKADRPVHIGDFAGGGAGPMPTGNVTAEQLERLAAEDPIEFERVAAKLSDEELLNLMGEF